MTGKALHYRESLSRVNRFPEAPRLWRHKNPSAHKMFTCSREFIARNMIVMMDGHAKHRSMQHLMMRAVHITYRFISGTGGHSREGFWSS